MTGDVCCTLSANGPGAGANATRKESRMRTGLTPTDAPSGQGRLQRRGLMAGAAALVAALLPRLGAPDRALAGHDAATAPTATNVLHLGVINDGGNANTNETDSSIANTTVLVAKPTDFVPALRVRQLKSGTGCFEAFGGDTINGVGGEGVRSTGGDGTLSGGTGVRAFGGLETGTGSGGAGVRSSGGASSAGAPGIGVVGTAGSGGTNRRVGVRGEADNSPDAIGVFGVAIGSNAGAASSPTGRAGVAGVSDAGSGVRGEATNGHGVFGQTSATAGTVVNGMLAAGLAGRTGGTIALYGYSDGPPNATYAPIGAVGQCESGFGVWGLSSAGPGASSRPGGGAVTAISGVLGTSANGLGMYAISSGSYALAADGTGPSTVGALIRGLGGAQAAVFVGNVQIQGNLQVTGTVGQAPAAVQADSRGAPAAANLSAPQTREVVVEDFGEGRLVGGRGEVRLDAAFAAQLQDAPYQVVLTEYDDHHALYVTGRTRQGFEVRAKDSPTASGTFSYRVVARARGAQAAGDRAPTPLHVPTIPTPQGVPTLPVGRETPQTMPAPKPDAH
jgi:hypothetical protein